MNLLSILLAGDPAKSVWTISTPEDLVWLLLSFTVLVGMLILCVVAIYLLLVLRKLLAPVSPVSAPVESRTLWQRVSGLRPLEQEKDLVMDHAYDGIQELNNPTPPWFMAMFYSTIAFATVYLLVFHVFGSGNVMATEYAEDMAAGEQVRAAYIKKVAGSINENTVKEVKDAKSLADGKSIFTQHCVVCHGAQGQGGIGPNLTDEYWLHGGGVKSIYRTLVNGVVEKGMMSWKKQLNPLQMQQVASFILSLKDSKPAGAKEPQGIKEESDKVVVSR